MAACQRLGFFEQGERAESAAFEVFPFLRGGGGFKHGVIGLERLFFALFRGVLFVGKLFQRGAAEVLQAVEKGGLVLRVGEQIVVNGQRLHQRRGVGTALRVERLAEKQAGGELQRVLGRQGFDPLLEKCGGFGEPVHVDEVAGFFQMGERTDGTLGFDRLVEKDQRLFLGLGVPPSAAERAASSHATWARAGLVSEAASFSSTSRAGL